MSAVKPKSQRYGAFISYRHVEPDRSWAKWLHAALESYRTPRALVRQLGLAARIGRVFRDEEEVPASHSLSAEIDSALVESGALVVICSPRAPESKWMDREIARFRELGRHDRVLALLIEGEPRTAFPPSLRSMRQAVVNAEGTEVERVLDVEPLAAAVRPRPHDTPSQLRRRARLSLAAGILGCRFDDLRQRDNERRWRRLRWVAVGLASLVLVLALLIALTVSARREADRSAFQAAQDRDEVLRLADVKIVRELIQEADTLWPVKPGEVQAAMSDWITRARESGANRAVHQASLARLRDHPTPPSGDRTTAWRVQVLEELFAGLDALQDPRQPTRGLIAAVARRLEDAATLRKRSIEDHLAAWQQTAQGILGDPRYVGLRLAPQLGLVPLGPDPDSHLYEFAHLGSGTTPARDSASGRLQYGDHAAIVLVLLPGDTFRMGAQRQEASAPNYDRAAENDEGPVREVTLSPFLIGKHEWTRAQWMALTEGPDPSSIEAGHVVAGKPITLRSPVEQVAWNSCVGTPGWLLRHRLTLPTEAQWEYACRAGIDTPWSYGREASSLQGAANIADRWASSHDWLDSWGFTPEVDDGYRLYAPVGSFRPNAFGLHDMHGNVWEWCLDAYGPYAAVSGRDPVASIGGVRVHRGGGWSSSALQGRSAIRRYVTPSLESDGLGFRVAHLLTSAAED